MAVAANAAQVQIPDITKEFLGGAIELLRDENPTHNRTMTNFIPPELAGTYRDLNSKASSQTISLTLFQATEYLKQVCIGRLASVTQLDLHAMNKTLDIQVAFDLPAMAAGLAEEALAPIVERCRTGIATKAEKFGIGTRANTRALKMAGEAGNEIKRVLDQLTRAMERRFCKIVLERLISPTYFIPVNMRFFVPAATADQVIGVKEFFDHEKNMFNLFNKPDAIERLMRAVNLMDISRKGFRILRDSPWKALSVAIGTGEHVRALEYKRGTYEHSSFGAQGDSHKIDHNKTLMKSQATASGLDIEEIPAFFEDNDMLNPINSLGGETEVGQFWVIPAHTSVNHPPEEKIPQTQVPRQYVRLVDYENNRWARVSTFDIVDEIGNGYVDAAGNATLLAIDAMGGPAGFDAYIGAVGLENYYKNPNLAEFEVAPGNKITFLEAFRDSIVSNTYPFREVCRQAHNKGVLIPFHGLVLRPHMRLSRNDALLTTETPPSILAHSPLATQVGVIEPNNMLKLQADVYAASVCFDPLSVHLIRNAQVTRFISGCGVNWKDIGRKERSLFGVLLPYDATDVLKRATMDITGKFATPMEYHFTDAGDSTPHYRNAKKIASAHEWKAVISDSMLSRGIYQPTAERNTVVHRGYCDMPVFQEGSKTESGIYSPPDDHFGVPFELNPANRYLSSETNNSGDKRLALPEYAYAVPDLHI